MATTAALLSIIYLRQYTYFRRCSYGLAHKITYESQSFLHHKDNMIAAIIFICIAIILLTLDQKSSFSSLEALGAVGFDELKASGRSESPIMRIEIGGMDDNGPRFPSKISIETTQQNFEALDTSLQLFLSLEVEVQKLPSEGSNESRINFDLALCIESSNSPLRPFQYNSPCGGDLSATIHNQAYFDALTNDISTESKPRSVELIRSLSLFRDTDVDFAFLYTRSLNISLTNKLRQEFDFADWAGWAIYLEKTSMEPSSYVSYHIIATPLTPSSLRYRFQESLRAYYLMSYNYLQKPVFNLLSSIVAKVVIRLRFAIDDGTLSAIVSFLSHDYCNEQAIIDSGSCNTNVLCKYSNFLNGKPCSELGRSIASSQGDESGSYFELFYSFVVNSIHWSLGLLISSYILVFIATKINYFIAVESSRQKTQKYHSVINKGGGKRIRHSGSNFFIQALSHNANEKIGHDLVELVFNCGVILQVGPLLLIKLRCNDPVFFMLYFSTALATALATAFINGEIFMLLLMFPSTFNPNKYPIKITVTPSSCIFGLAGSLIGFEFGCPSWHATGSVTSFAVLIIIRSYLFRRRRRMFLFLADVFSFCLGFILGFILEIIKYI